MKKVYHIALSNPVFPNGGWQKAFEENVSLQDIFNRALEQYLEKDAKKQAKKIIFKTHDLGVPLDNLRRKDYYPNL